MKNKLNIDVNARVTVSDDMAERCLRLLEMWQEDNPDKCIEFTETRLEDDRFGVKLVAEFSICDR